MGKSKYPNKLDTSLEIPAVRDNIVEVGSDVLNSLRSAIFNIERTLGINPQGAAGNTVASRINKSLDGNGNILKEALDTAGLLSGPITNSDVSKTAGIEESKLKLEYPTTLLQDEISQLISQIKSISETLEELAYLYTAHTHPEAMNRHMAKAITVEAIGPISSEVGMVSTERKTSQEFFESIFSSHINYDGTGISATNRSHKADQIFFDKADVSGFVNSDDTQGAIEDVLQYATGQLVDHQNKSHSNGIIRSNIIEGEEAGVGSLILGEQEVLFFKYSTEETTRLTTISFPVPPDVPTTNISKSDILRLYSAVDEQVYDFQIHSVSYSSDGSTIESLKIFGMLQRDSVSLDRIKIFQNKNKEITTASLIVSARPYPNAVNLDLIQLANPGAATIVSRKIRPSEISVNNRYLKIVVDGTKEVDVDAYDGTASKPEGIDSIINSINKDLTAAAASALAYRVDFDDLRSSEIAIIHTMPSSSSQTFSISVQRGADDAIDSLGFGYMEDLVENSPIGSEFYIQGEPSSFVGTKLEQTGLALVAGTSSVSSFAADINFEDFGVVDGDLLLITGSSSDDGTYVIEDVSENSILVDADQLSSGIWQGEAGEDATFFILKNTLLLRDFEFLKSLGSGNAAIIDIFIDKNKDIFYNTRLEYGIVTYLGSDSLIAPCNFKGNVEVYTQDSPGIISASLNADNEPQISLDGGEPKNIAGVTNSYVSLRSAVHNVELSIYIENSDYVFSKVDADGSFDIELFGESDINKEENLVISRVLFDASRSRVAGAGTQTPRVFRIKQDGVTSDKDLSTDALKRVYQDPISDMRSNGVVDGLVVTSALTPPTENDNYVVNISGGTCYVGGKKFIFEGYQDLTTNIKPIDADKVFVAINKWGEIVFGGASASGGALDCASPFSAESHCILSCLEYDSLNPPVPIDLRLLIDNLDLKLLNSITVSPQAGMGHFQDVGKALKYAKGFTDIFPDAGTPTVHLKSGVHKLDAATGVNIADYNDFAYHIRGASESGHWINFPVNIVGEGESTVLDITRSYLDQGLENDDRADSGAAAHQGHLIIAGPGVTSTPDGNPDVLDGGFVRISNLKMRLCDILIVDGNTQAGGNILNFGIDIDNVIFDYSEKSGFNNANYAVYFYRYNALYTSKVGNVSIRNCNFLNCHIRLSSFSPSSYQKMIISGNYFRGDGTGLGGYNNYAFHGVDLTNFDKVPPGNNVEIRGNILSDYHIYEPDPDISDGTEDPWADRVDRNLNVGKRITIGSGDYPPGAKEYGLILHPARFEDDGNGLKVSEGEILVEEGRIHVEDGVTLNDSDQTSGFIIAGRTDSENVTIDPNEIQSRAAASGNYLYINRKGGNVILGTLSFNPGTKLQVEGSGYFEEDITAEETIRVGDHFEINKGYEAPFIEMTSSATSLFTPTISMYSGDSGFDWSDGKSLGIMEFGRAPNGISGAYKETTAAISGRFDSGYANWAWVDTASAPTRLSFHVTPPGTLDSFGGLSGNQMHEVMRCSAGGWTSISSYENSLTLDDLCGELIVGTHKNGSHIAMNHDTIQAKDSPITKGSLYLNRLGGVTRIGQIGTGPGDNSDTDSSSVLFVQSKFKSSVSLYKFISFRIWSPSSGAEATIGNIESSDGAAVAYNAFTGQHIAPITNVFTEEHYKEGLIVSSDGTTLNKSSISESFSGAIITTKDKDKAVYGVVSGSPWTPKDDDWDFPEDQRAINVNSLGNGRIWVTNINGDVENGDYICSSNIAGYGRLQDDDILHNYTVAKATETVDWSKVNETISHNGSRYKKYLIACTYHCG